MVPSGSNGLMRVRHACSLSAASVNVSISPPFFSLCCCHSNCASFFCIHGNPSSSPWMQGKEGLFLIISLDQLLFCHSLHPFMYHILQFVYADKQNRDALTHYCLKRFTRQILRSSLR